MRLPKQCGFGIWSLKASNLQIGRECLWAAKSATPFGPFEKPEKLFDVFSIDPHVVRADNGLFLWYCMDRTDTDRVGTRITAVLRR